MTLPDYDTGWDSNRRPKPDGLVEWLEDAIKGEPEAEAVIAAVQEARRKAKAFDWLEEALWNAWYRGHQPFRVDDGKRLILIECIRGEPKLLLAIEAERKR